MSSPNAPKPKVEAFLQQVGSHVTSSFQTAGGIVVLGIKTLKSFSSKPFYFNLMVEQMFLIGVRSFLLVAVTGLATGSVMTLQFSYGLEKFGGKMYVPRVVALSIVRELGPVFTSLLVAGRIGSGIAAEVASMKVTQQIDAIRALGTDPIKRIVAPRLLATVITLPLLTIFADVIGLFGGMLVAMQESHISATYFIEKCIEVLRPVDFATGFLKTLVFAVFIALCACHRGMTSEGGTQGVGDSTTYVVVTTNIFIMISDFFLTKLFLLTLPYVQ